MFDLHNDHTYGRLGERGTVQRTAVGFGYVQFRAQVAQQILPDPDAQDAVEFRVAGKPGVQRRGEPGRVLRALLAGGPLFVPRLEFPSHPASRRRTCPLANLRLYIQHMVSGLSPDWIRAMHGTHVKITGAAWLYRAASV